MRSELCETRGSLLEQLDVTHDELLPVHKDHGHLLLCQKLTVQQRLVEDLHTGNQTLNLLLFVGLYIITPLLLKSKVIKLLMKLYLFVSLVW